jgi:hypothetical protein
MTTDFRAAGPHCHSLSSLWAAFALACWTLVVGTPTLSAAPPATTISIEVDRGDDVGQSFGSLFEVTSTDGSLVVGAGFQNLYNTYYRADRHAVQFFVRSTTDEQALSVDELPRPNALCGTYLTGRDETLRSVFGGTKVWDPKNRVWQPAPDSREAMRVGEGLLEWSGSSVLYQGQPILNPPEEGSYAHFFYARGYLCFYHINRREGGYRPWTSDEDGFSKLYACPWKAGEERVDLTRAVVHTLPVVGETTFAWGQHGTQVITGSNVGGFYVFDGGRWSRLLLPDLKVSYQLYSTMAFSDRLVMGQYPTGRLFEYDGATIVDKAGWPPVLPGVSSSSREAQTTVIYGGELYVGVWPWGEVWRYHPDRDTWTFARRMFAHPELSAAITHPYDVENKGNAVSNQWGQRVTSLVTNGPDLFVSTSAKDPCVWEPEKNPFLAPDNWKSYGAVYRLSAPGHLGANTKWTTGPTRLEFVVSGEDLVIRQDGKELARSQLTGSLAERVATSRGWKPLRLGNGLYGAFDGKKLTGELR